MDSIPAQRRNISHFHHTYDSIRIYTVQCSGADKRCDSMNKIHLAKVRKLSIIVSGVVFELRGMSQLLVIALTDSRGSFPASLRSSGGRSHASTAVFI